MAATYMPLVGGSNIQAVLDSGGNACVAAQISGEVAEGRAGSLKTSFLIALANATEGVTTIDTAFGNLASFTLFGPYSHPVPAAPAATNFDYSSILPVCRGSLVATGFVPVAAAWPASLSTYLAVAEANPPTVVYQLQVVPTAVNPVSGSTQYGLYTFRVRGGISALQTPQNNPLILVEVDFSHSLPN